MGQRTSLYTAVFDLNRFVLNPPTILVQNLLFEAGIMFPLQYEHHVLAPVAQGQQSMYVQAVRFWSNFADGLVFTSTNSPSGWVTPTIYLFKSDTVPVDALHTPNDYLVFQTCNLNEWCPVEKPLPGISNALASPMFALISGSWQFETISIDPAYTGKNVLFGIQAMLSISNL
jgi:hypothetical protein